MFICLTVLVFFYFKGVKNCGSLGTHGDLTLLNSRSPKVLKEFAVPVQHTLQKSNTRHNLKLNSMDFYSFAVL